MPSSLEHLIAPLSRADFFSQYWGERFLIGRDSERSIESLFSWDALSEILSTQRLDFPRLSPGSCRESRSICRVHAAAIGSPRFVSHDSRTVMDLLDAGAALHITSIGEAWQPLATLGAQLELYLTARVQINVHAGLAASRGFDTHWDGHDVFAVQIAGKKRWRLFGVTEVAPLPCGSEYCEPRSEFLL